MGKQLTMKGDDAHCILCASFDYSFGRKTYMPSVMTGFIRANVDDIETRTLRVFEKRLEQAEKDYRDNWKTEVTERGYSNYGTEADRAYWQEFHKWIKQALQERELYPDSLVLKRFSKDESSWCYLRLTFDKIGKMYAFTIYERWKGKWNVTQSYKRSNKKECQDVFNERFKALTRMGYTIEKESEVI